MKNLTYFISTLFATALLLSACTFKVMEATTTHKQVMDRFKTKDQIVARFGLPSSKKNEGGYEEWLYDYGTKTVTDAAAVGSGYSGTRTAGSVVGGAVGNRTSVVGAAAGYGASNTAVNTSAKSRTVTQDVKTYIKFTLKGENVVTWETNGVDYSVYEKVTKKFSELKK